MKIINIECSVIDGLVCIQITRDNGDFTSVSIPEQNFAAAIEAVAATEHDTHYLQ